MRHVSTLADGAQCEWYAIHDVYYRDGEIAWGMDPQAPQGDTCEILKDDLQLMLGAFEKPVLDYDMEPECEGPPRDDEEPSDE